MREIAKRLHLPPPDGLVLYDLDTASKSLHTLSRQEWWTEAEKKTKLECYVDFKDRSEPKTIVSTNLSRMR